MSRALRHEPWLYELEVDECGWVPLDQLVDALNRDRRWGDIHRSDVVEMVGRAHKQRHEIQGDRIRALYGHSLPGRIVKTPGMPPPSLFHGTAQESVSGILVAGLSPMSRQYVHLSVDRKTAIAVGRRKSARVAVLIIDAVTAHADGVVFLQGNSTVWLSEHVPPAFVRLG